MMNLAMHRHRQLVVNMAPTKISMPLNTPAVVDVEVVIVAVVVVEEAIVVEAEVEVAMLLPLITPKRMLMLMMRLIHLPLIRMVEAELEGVDEGKAEVVVLLQVVVAEVVVEEGSILTVIIVTQMLLARRLNHMCCRRMAMILHVAGSIIPLVDVEVLRHVVVIVASILISISSISSSSHIIHRAMPTLQLLTPMVGLTQPHPRPRPHLHHLLRNYEHMQHHSFLATFINYQRCCDKSTHTDACHPIHIVKNLLFISRLCHAMLNHSFSVD